MPQLTLTIDGSKVHDFKTFIDEFNRVYSRFDVLWNGNLDAFNDYLAWPDERYVLVWEQSGLSRAGLGYGEMRKGLEERVRNCQPANGSHMRERLESAKLGNGQTMVDLLWEIIEGNSDYVE